MFRGVASLYMTKYLRSQEEFLNRDIMQLCFEMEFIFQKKMNVEGSTYKGTTSSWH